MEKTDKSCFKILIFKMTIKIAIIGDSFIPSKIFKSSIERKIKKIRPKIKIKYSLKDFNEKKLKPFISSEISEAFGNLNDVIKFAKNSNILITTFAPITSQVLKKCQNLLVVACGRGGPINVNIKFGIESLNVANACSIALYEFSKSNSNQIVVPRVGLELTT